MEQKKPKINIGSCPRIPTNEIKSNWSNDKINPKEKITRRKLIRGTYNLL